MPASAVLSPGAGDLDAQRAGAVDRSRDDVGIWTLGHGSRFASDHRLVDVARAVAHGSVGWNARARAHEYQVSDSQIRGRDFLRPLADEPRGGVGEELGQFIQRALCLGDRAHLDPVAENHDRDERRELPPEVHAREAQRDGHD